MPEQDTLTIEMEPVRGDREFGPVQPEPQQVSGVAEEQLLQAFQFEHLESPPYDAELARTTNEFLARAVARADDDRREDLARQTVRAETHTASPAWLDQESMRIRQEAASSVFETAEEAALASAYYNGRREAFNSARENFIAVNPDAAKRLPVAIDIQEVQVRTREQAYETPSMEIGS